MTVCWYENSEQHTICAPGKTRSSTILIKQALYVQLFGLKTASSTNMSAQTNHFRLEVMALQYQELLLHAILLKHLM